MDQILVSGTKYTGGAAQKARPVSCNERGIKYWWEIANVRYHWMEPTFYSLLWRSFLCKLGFWPPNVGHNSGWFWGKIKNSLFQMIQALICDSSVLGEDDDNSSCTIYSHGWVCSTRCAQLSHERKGFKRHPRGNKHVPCRRDEGLGVTCY